MSKGIELTLRDILPDDWNVKRLVDLSLGGAKNGYFKKPELVGSGYKLINVSELYQTFGIDTDLATVERVQANAVDFERYKVKAGDVFFTRSSLVLSGIAACNIISEIKEPTLFECHVMKVTPDISQVIPAFVAYCCQQSFARSFLMSRAKHTTMTTIAQPEVESVLLPVPSLTEQRKITQVLVTIDNLIEKTEDLIAKYQTVKQGMMHDLFTRGVDVAGKLRPTFEDAPELYKESAIGWIPKEWEVKKMVTLLKEISYPMRSGPFGSALLKSELVENGIPFLGIDNVHREYFSLNFSRFMSPDKFRELSRYSVRERDVMITIMGTVGRCCLVPSGIGDALSSKHIWTMTFEEEKYIPELICWQLNYAPWVLQHLDRASQGAVMDAISSATLKNLRLPCPPISEQKIILERYLSIQKYLGDNQAQFLKLQKLKSGLMQDLLTGKVRVTIATATASP